MKKELIKKLLIRQLQRLERMIEDDELELNDEEISELFSAVNHCPLSKEQAAQELNISRSTFDSKVQNGDIPKGRKRKGFKELVWYKDELRRS